MVPSEKLVSVIYNHSTHTIGTLHGNVRSASFYGLAAQELEQKFGVPVVFLEGASGSTHYMKGSVQEAIDRLKADVTQGVETGQAELHRPDHRPQGAVSLQSPHRGTKRSRTRR